MNSAFVVILYASLCAYYSVLAAPERNNMIIDEIFQVMREFEDKNEKEEIIQPVTMEPQSVKDMTYETCPAPSASYTDMTATCTELTYSCTNEKHVLIFDDDGLCTNNGKASRNCNAEGKVRVPRCSAVCTIEEVANGHWLLHQPNGVMVSDNQVLPGSQISYYCVSDKFTLSSSAKLTCQDNGKFTGDFPTCTGLTYENVTECGGGDWIRLSGFDMSSTGSEASCPYNWQRVEHDNVVGCHGKVNGACSPFYVEVGQISVKHVCGRAVGHQIAFPDAFAASSGLLDELYVDGISITYDFPRKHIWTYGVGASEVPLFGGTRGNCPCQKGSKQPPFVGSHMYCDSGHTAVASIEEDINNPKLYSTIYKSTLWEKACGEENTQTCCGANPMEGINPPWFVRDIGNNFAQASLPRFEIRLCSHEVDMQEGALITAFELYVKE